MSQVPHATVKLVDGDWRPACVKCNQDADVTVDEGIMADEEQGVCASCLFLAVVAYPEEGQEQ